MLGLLLAGGRSRRMGGGDKCLVDLGGRPLLAHVVARARPQVAELLLSAHGDPARFTAFGLPVVADPLPDHAGPLAGVLAGLEWARAHRPDLAWMVSIAGDTPFFPSDLVARLEAAVTAEGADLAVAASAGRIHPVFTLWPVRLADELRRAITVEGERKAEAWLIRHRLAVAAFATEAGDPFLNINRPEDLALARRLLAGGEGAES